MKLIGYADKMSVVPGGDITFMVSSEFPTYSAELVRLIHGDDRAEGPGFKAEPVAAEFAGDHAGGQRHGGHSQKGWGGPFFRPAPPLSMATP